MIGLLRRVVARFRTVPQTQERLNGKLSYEQMRELARHPSVRVRARLAERSDIRPEILYFLANDDKAEVRKAAALNPATPHRADLVLARDTNPDVRSRLAEKLSQMVPGLDHDERSAVMQRAHEVMELLARDQLVRVREIIAQSLKDLTSAPPQVIRRLAHDTELSVSGPILENSPVLTEEDLLEIIVSPPVRGALSAISRRRTVAPKVADAIAATEDPEAVAALLNNPRAQIREETLDHLISRSREVEEWQGPLIRRPSLSPMAAARLARFVADHLLAELRAREDLAPDTALAVARLVRERIDEAGRRQTKAPPEMAVMSETPESLARRLHNSGLLDEMAISRALSAGDEDFVLTALAVRAGMPADVVRKVVTAHSAKGVTALAWRAGLTMRAAVQLQARLAHIAPSDILRAKGREEYPLSDEEMNWQLDFFLNVATGT